MSFREVTLWFFGLLLLIGLFVGLENPIYETLESVTISGLMLSLGHDLEMRPKKPPN
jgi:hypothetical protein